jgi:hypothetical protein
MARQIPNLSDYVYYDETSPTLLRRSPNKLSARTMYRAHQPVGKSISGQGYRPVYITGHGDYYAHRLIWQLHYGVIPDGMVVDHKDRDRTNNKISNLRCVTQAVNSANTTPPANKHGHTGVSYDKRDGKYYAKVHVTRDGRRVQKILGSYATAEEAGKAFQAAKLQKYPCSTVYQETKVFEPGIASLLMFCG